MTARHAKQTVRQIRRAKSCKKMLLNNLMIGAPIGCPGKEITMAVTDKATFILNNEYIEQVQKLNDTQAGQLFRTILLYANEQNVDDPADPMVSMVFSFIRQQMDKDYKKYEETCKKRAENGKKGGRPRKNDTVSCDEPVGEAAHSLPNDAYAEETEKPNGFFGKKEKAKKADSECESDCDCECDCDSDCDVLDTISGDGGEEEEHAWAREVIHIFEDQYRTIPEEYAKFNAFADELFVRYGHKQPTEYDRKQVFEYCHSVAELDADTTIAVLDDTKAELLRYVFGVAANADRVTWSYIDGIYANFRYRGIQCVEDAYRDNWEYYHGSVPA